MLNNLPDDLILELGQSLEKAELSALYAVSRRFREIIMKLLSRNISLTSKDLPDILSFVAEDRHFAPSVSTLHLKYDQECQLTPILLSAAIVDIQHKTKKEFPEQLSEILVERNSRACVILLLASLSRLTGLDIWTSSISRVVSYDILGLLSRGYLPRIQYFDYMDLWIEPSDYLFHSTSKLLLDMETAYTRTMSKLNLKSMCIQVVNVDMRLIRWALEIPASLVTFNFSCRGVYNSKVSFSGLGDAIKLHADSLEDIDITFPNYKLPPRSSLLPGYEDDSPSIIANTMFIGGFHHFKALTWLGLPFDLLLEPDPSTATSFSHLLPATLKSLSLRSCIFQTSGTFGALQLWEIDQIFAVLNVTIHDLPSTCPFLEWIGIGCLPYEEFESLDQIWEEIRDSKYEKEGSRSQSDEASNGTSNIDTGSRLGFVLDWTGDDGEYEDASVAGSDTTHTHYSEDENDEENEWEDYVDQQIANGSNE